MGSETTIAWTGASWNFIRGCDLVSEECASCYAMITAARFCKEGEPYYQIATRNKGGSPMWTGKIGFYEHMLDLPLRWKRPRLIFVNSMSDLFHEDLSVDLIRRGFDVMEKANWHIFQCLTKRAERMREIMNNLVLSSGRHLGKQPLENVWLGTSVGLEKSAHRIQSLAQTPAAIRFISGEPLIFSGVNWRKHLQIDGKNTCEWLILGGESQVNSRRCPIDNIREGIAICREFGIAPFVKQLGRVWAKEAHAESLDGKDILEFPDEFRVQEFPIDVGAYLKKKKSPDREDIPLPLFPL